MTRLALGRRDSRVWRRQTGREGAATEPSTGVQWKAAAVAKKASRQARTRERVVRIHRRTPALTPASTCEHRRALLSQRPLIARDGCALWSGDGSLVTRLEFVHSSPRGATQADSSSPRTQ